ncbi:MAG: esterase-like activity of phytase family protein [Oscillatoria sp. SIO1A7]|nr:esterase-like activity of phytase family protein [Oscillatoria sp. SIO1A7]
MLHRRQQLFFPWLFALVLALFTLLAGCSLPTISAQERLFLDISLEFLDDYTLPKQRYEGTLVGGLSGITYDRQSDRFYALSDDQGIYAPARFYTLKLNLDTNELGTPEIKNIQIEDVTLLADADGQTYSNGEINPEGIAWAAPDKLYISSEGVTDKNVAPFISEVDLETGRWQRSLPVPDRYIANASGEQRQGVQENLGFESLTINPRGFGDATVDPYNLFTATEAPLAQDRNSAGLDSGSDSPQPARNRFLQYLIGDGPPLLLAEYAYPLDIGGRWSIINSLTELLALDRGGHLLSLERSFGLVGYGAKIFQVTTAGATDTTSIASLQNNNVQSLRKQLELDLGNLGITLDNLEGMTIGPRLADGTQSLILVSDDNFNDDQATQFLLFRL